MFDKITNASAQLVFMMKENFVLVMIMLGTLWACYLLNLMTRGRLNNLGIHPRTFRGLFGVFFAPFLHGDVNHLLFNTIPLFFLLNFALAQGVNYFICLTLIIGILSGFAIWLIGRRAIHIGASALSMGYWSYLLANAYQHPSAFSVIIALITLYYLGGLVTNLFPSGPGVSWEGHVAGFAAGLFAVYLCPYIMSHPLVYFTSLAMKFNFA